MSVSCSYCDKEIPTRAKMPLRVVADDDGRPVIPTDYSSVYEHMRDEHPDHWTEELAVEFERECPTT